jgi:hypothetical protein
VNLVVAEIVPVLLIGMLPASGRVVRVSTRAQGSPAPTVSERRWQRLLQRLQRFDRHLCGRAGWARVLRNTLVGFVIQAGTRMAAALSYYALLAAGPMLVLTIALGSLLLGEQTTRELVAVTLPKLLPPSAGAATSLAEQVVQTSPESTGLAIMTGLVSLIGFARALATSLNVTWRAERHGRRAWRARSSRSSSTTPSTRRIGCEARNPVTWAR